VTDEQINIAIGEARGFQNINGILCDDVHGWPALLPKYANDLNAMHEAEQVLTDDQYFDYCRKRLPSAQKSEIAQGRTATARQRAEAFLRAIGKWEGV
jgi:hypothetical protein